MQVKSLARLKFAFLDCF